MAGAALSPTTSPTRMSVQWRVPLRVMSSARKNREGEYWWDLTRVSDQSNSRGLRLKLFRLRASLFHLRPRRVPLLRFHCWCECAKPLEEFKSRRVTIHIDGTGLSLRQATAVLLRPESSHRLKRNSRKSITMVFLRFRRARI